MGRESICQCRVGAATYAVKALLESTSLILRGEFKRTLAFSEISRAKVAGGRLEFSAGGEKFSLELGQQEAVWWLGKMTRPPATLADKLGLKGDAKAYVIGTIEDTALREAVEGHSINAAQQASVCIAVTITTEQLEVAIEAHLAASHAPLWIAHPKGSKSGLTEAMVRSTMRSRGYMDTKVSAVSDGLTATRYNRSS